VQDQTTYMRKLKLQAVIGGCIIEVNQSLMERLIWRRQSFILSLIEILQNE